MPAYLGAQAPAKPVLRPVAFMSNYSQPIGIVEQTPGLFYIQPSYTNQDVVTVSSHGAQSTVASFTPTQGFTDGILVGGPNGQLYSLLNKAQSVFSVSAATGAKLYNPIGAQLTLTQNLPGGQILGVLIGKTFSLAKVALNGAVAPFYTFPDADALPNVALFASDGNYYGIFYQSGGSGGVYRVTPAGVMTVLHTFPPLTLNNIGIVPLLQASDGNLYGALPSGGANSTGLIFKLTLGGQYTGLYEFPKGPYYMPTSLIEASDGNLYGTTWGFAVYSLFFRITKSGQYTTLADMAPNSVGQCVCLLIQGSDGLIYGSAQSGGVTGGGTVFSVGLGLGKPAPLVPSFQPASGPAGTKVLLWGTNLLSPSVQFNGLAASEVVSSGPNYVWATVPTGAASGPITVTTPGGTFATKASFTVE